MIQPTKKTNTSSDWFLNALRRLVGDGPHITEMPKTVLDMIETIPPMVAVDVATVWGPLIVAWRRKSWPALRHPLDLECIFLGLASSCYVHSETALQIGKALNLLDPRKMALPVSIPKRAAGYDFGYSWYATFPLPVIDERGMELFLEGSHWPKSETVAPPFGPLIRFLSLLPGPPPRAFLASVRSLKKATSIPSQFLAVLSGKETERTAADALAQVWGLAPTALALPWLAPPVRYWWTLEMPWRSANSGMLGTLASKAIIVKLEALSRKIKNVYWIHRYRASGQLFRLDDDRELLFRLPSIGDDDWRQEVQLMLEITALGRKVETPKNGVFRLRDIPAIQGVWG